MTEGDEAKAMINGYVFAQVIGKGNYGLVYKGTKEGRVYAIKQLDMKTFEGNTHRSNLMTRLLQAEISVMQRINSPYVVKLYDTFRTKQKIYMVMEYCDEPNLQDLIEQGAVANSQAVIIMKQILSGVAALHNLPVIHRDLKPQNILRKEGRYKIGDLGFARVLEHKNSIANTILGTPMYMAPEIVYQRPYTTKVDIWSLGVIFYQLVFHKVPYPYKSSANCAMRKVIEETKVDFESVNVPAGSIDFIKRCLVIDPNLRIGWKEIKSHRIFKQNSLSLSMGVLHNLDLGLLPVPQNICSTDDFSILQENQGEAEHSPNVNPVLSPIAVQPRPLIPIQEDKIKEQQERMKPTRSELTKSFAVIQQQRLRNNIFARYSAKITYEKNCLVVLLDYLVNIQDRVAEAIFNQSRKLTELRLLVCLRCIKKANILTDLLEKRKNVYNFQCFEDYTTTEEFEELRKQNMYFSEHIKHIHVQISCQLDKLRTSFKHQFLDFFGNRQEQVEKEKILMGEEGKDFDIDSHTIFTEKLIKKVCHKFTDTNVIKPSFYMYMFIWTVQRYRSLIFNTENQQRTEKEVNEMFEQVKRLQRSHEDWRKKINEIAKQISGREE